MAAFVYILCALTSSLCAVLLLINYRRTGLRLLLWSGACFVCLAAGNIILFIDLIVLPEIDLLLGRNLIVLLGLLLLMFGLIWDTEKEVTMLNQFLNGAIMFGYLIAAVFFLRFWRRSMERLFAIFSAAFFVLAAERIVLAMVKPEHEFHPYVYLVRLIAFLLIIIAIVDKNRSSKPNVPR